MSANNLKISHVCLEDIVTKVIDSLDKVLRQEALLAVTRGLVHEYLGMTLDYGTPGKVMI